MKQLSSTLLLLFHENPAGGEGFLEIALHRPDTSGEHDHSVWCRYEVRLPDAIVGDRSIAGPFGEFPAELDRSTSSACVHLDALEQSYRELAAIRSAIGTPINVRHLFFSLARIEGVETIDLAGGFKGAKPQCFPVAAVDAAYEHLNHLFAEYYSDRRLTTS